MARAIPGQSDIGLPNIEIVPNPSANSWDVYVTPSEGRIAAAGYDPSTTLVAPIPMMGIDFLNKRFFIRPHETLPGIGGICDPKYKNIQAISLDLSLYFHSTGLPIVTSDDVFSALESLPSGMVKDANFGLGFKQSYRFIVSALNSITQKKVIYIGNNLPHYWEYHIPMSLYQDIVTQINRIDSRAKAAEAQVKDTVTYNLLAEYEGLKPREFKLGKAKIRHLLTRFLSDEDFADETIQEELVSTLARSAEKLARLNSKVTEELVSTIQKNRLEVAIERFEQMMAQARSELEWQKFFENDPFLLTFAFGHPITFVNGQSFVGGKRIDGKGENIADFLFKNALNNNAALIEIKKPQTPLLKPYRDSAKGPHKELSGAIVQVLNQKYELARRFDQMRTDNDWHGENEVNDFDIDCILVAGTMPSDKMDRRSFQLYRKNSHGVRIVTFDEILHQLKQVHEYMNEGDANSLV